MRACLCIELLLSVCDVLSFGKWARVCLDSELYGFVNWHHKFISASPRLQKAIISFVVSVRPFAWNSLPPTGQIYMKFDI